MKKSFFVMLLLLTFMVSSASAVEPLHPGVADKCPVCGMVVHPFPQWAAHIIFKDEKYEFFDGPKDMLKFYFNMSKYSKDKKKEDIAGIFVTNYYTTKPVDVNSVVFISGSDVMGPMGMELVPVSPDKVETFMKDHKGKKALKFSEITAADIPGAKMQHKEDKGHDKHDHGSH